MTNAIRDILRCLLGCGVIGPSRTVYLTSKAEQTAGRELAEAGICKWHNANPNACTVLERRCPSVELAYQKEVSIK